MNEAATGSSAEPSATTTNVTKTKSKKHAKPNGLLVCDRDVIDHVQEAIIHIKASRQQCNIPGIFAYLKERLPDNDKIAALTQKNLIQQLEMAVREGILSRKYTNNNMSEQVSPSSKLVTTYCSTPPQIVFKLPKPESFLTHIENDQVNLNPIQIVEILTLIYCFF